MGTINNINNNNNKTGYDAIFLGSLPKHLECIVCRLALRHPVQLTCGHRACHTCFTTLQNHYCRKYVWCLFTLPYHPVLVFRVLPFSLQPGLGTPGCLWSYDANSLCPGGWRQLDCVLIGHSWHTLTKFSVFFVSI